VGYATPPQNLGDHDGYDQAKHRKKHSRPWGRGPRCLKGARQNITPKGGDRSEDEEKKKAGEHFFAPANRGFIHGDFLDCFNLMAPSVARLFWLGAKLFCHK
jgi:hypothetical protein